MKEESKNDLKRINRISDMMVTGHSVLQYRYLLFSFFVEVLIFLSSTFLCIFCFVDEKIITNYIGQEVKYIIGLFSVFTLFITYCAEKFNWKVKAERHAQAAREFFALKQESKRLLEETDVVSNQERNSFFEEYSYVANAQIKISDSDFIKCKQKHLKKIEISKFLDNNPFVFLFLYKLKLIFRDNKK